MDFPIEKPIYQIFKKVFPKSVTESFDMNNPGVQQVVPAVTPYVPFTLYDKLFSFELNPNITGYVVFELRNQMGCF